LNRSRFYKVEVLFWSQNNLKTPNFAIQLHLPLQWTPCLLVATIWESVLSAHCITVFEMKSPLAKTTGSNITTINNISRIFDKKLDELKIHLAFSLVYVDGGEH